MDSLLVPYDGAYWALQSTDLTAEQKLVKIKGHLKEMTALRREMNHCWAEEQPAVIVEQPVVAAEQPAAVVEQSAVVKETEVVVVEGSSGPQWRRGVVCPDGSVRDGFLEPSST